jgi:hypothetical protein
VPDRPILIIMSFRYPYDNFGRLICDPQPTRSISQLALLNISRRYHKMCFTDCSKNKRVNQLFRDFFDRGQQGWLDYLTLLPTVVSDISLMTREIGRIIGHVVVPAKEVEVVCLCWIRYSQ